MVEETARDEARFNVMSRQVKDAETHLHPNHPTIEELRKLTLRMRMTGALLQERALRTNRSRLVVLLYKTWLVLYVSMDHSSHSGHFQDSIRLTICRHQTKDPKRQASELREKLLREKIKKMRTLSITGDAGEAHANSSRG